MTKNIITAGYYTAYRVFNYNKKIPFYGLASYKVNYNGDTHAIITSLKGEPEVVIPLELLQEAIKKDWVMTKGKTRIIYFPEDKIKRIRDTVEPIMSENIGF